MGIDPTFAEPGMSVTRLDTAAAAIGQDQIAEDQIAEDQIPEDQIADDPAIGDQPGHDANADRGGYDGPDRHDDADGSSGDDVQLNPRENGAAPATASKPVSDTVDEDEIDDAQLIRRIAEERDKAAFSLLFKRYGLKLKAFMIRSGAAPDAADEAAQETLLAVWRRAETFDPTRASAPAWLFAIARNKRVDLLRRGARPEPDAEDPTFRPEPEPTPDNRLAAQRRDEAVRAALSELSEDQRQVVILSFYEGCAHSEISERIGAPLGTVKSRLRLAFSKLRGALGAGFKAELDEG